MMSNGQLKLVSLVFHRAHDVAIDAKDLDAVGAHGLERADAGASRIGVRRPAELRVDENAGRGDQSPRARVAPGEGLARVAADVANGGDAAGQPDLEFGFDWLRETGTVILEVRMRVDQSRQNVLATGVDLGSPRIDRTPAPDTSGRHPIARR